MIFNIPGCNCIGASTVATMVLRTSTRIPRTTRILITAGAPVLLRLIYRIVLVTAETARLDMFKRVTSCQSLWSCKHMNRYAAYYLKENTSLSKKRFDDLFKYIVSEINVYDAYRKTQLGQMKYKRGAICFSQDITVNLATLQEQVASGDYRPNEYHAFRVYEPKERLIYASAFEDKIVQHMVNNILKDIYRPCFVYDNYSCIEGKGTHACVERISKNLRAAKRNYGPGAYIVKVDISKFFYSMDREFLKGLLRKKIKCNQTLALLDIIIDSSPGDIGLPLGNLTSQLFANIYLNELDQFCKRILGLEYYVRYADDIIIVVEDRDHARQILEEIRVYADNCLNLSLNPKKSKVFPLAQGVNSIGFKIHPTHRLLRNDSKKRVKRKIKKMPHLINEGCMTIEKANQMLGSWTGHAMYGCSLNFIQKLLRMVDYLYMDKGRLKINENNINYGGNNAIL